MTKGPQTKARAIFQGLPTVAQFGQTPITVIVQLALVWEAWTNPKKRKGFYDLAPRSDRGAVCKNQTPLHKQELEHT